MCFLEVSVSAKENAKARSFYQVYAQETSGKEKAFKKLAALLGRESFEAELVLIDPKAKPDAANEEKIRNFCTLLTQLR